MGKIPDSVIEQIKESNDIVDVISTYISLTKKGQNYWARCPFHQEKTASFSVSPSKQIYHCFGCGVGGNVIHFVMEYEKVPFPEALKNLADRAGISLEAYTQDLSSDEKSMSSQLYELHQFAIDFYKKALKGPLGKEARIYLIKREINEKTLETFDIGYAPQAWDSLLKAATQKGFSENLLVLSGLVSESETKKKFDRFRNRIMFPIFDARGNPVGFGGRALSNEDQQPKYLNSPETLVYHKSRIFYGLHKSRDVIRKQDTVIIVEGYMDLLQLWQHGFTNIIAGSGTAFTVEHARIIKRFSSKAILCYDGDEAGQKAAVKAGLTLSPQGLTCRVLILPKDEDPDSFIRKVGADEFQRKINEAPDFIAYLETVIKPLRLSPAKRSETVTSLLNQLGTFSDPVIEEMFLRDLGQIFGIDMTVLKHQLRTGIHESDEAQKIYPQGKKEKRFANKAEATQYQILQLLVNTQDTSIRSAALKVLDENLFTHEFLKAVYKHIISQIRNNIHSEASKLAETSSDEKVRRFIFRLIMEDSPFKEPQKTFLDCVVCLHEQKIREQLVEIGEEIRETDKKGKFPGDLLHKKEALLKKLKQLPDEFIMKIFEENRDVK
ncbi:MAG: DNA primase [Candidatus Marinimicrobia bacterium]|nr:DNA primase [Candidatus Neomarinimicrobiota bacterium]